MAQTVVLFHSVLGLRPAVVRFADALCAAGHIVRTPDLFDGEVFDNVSDGARKRDALGIPALIGRAHAAVAALSSDVVYAGFSMGTGPALVLATTRPGARALVLMHGALAPSAVGVTTWPSVPVQLHFGVDDPWVDAGQVDALTTAVRAAGQRCEVHRYDVRGHLFADDDSPDHDAVAAAAMLDRVNAFLGSV